MIDELPGLVGRANEPSHEVATPTHKIGCCLGVIAPDRWPLLLDEVGRARRVRQLPVRNKVNGAGMA
jgi:hypothetical protein